MTQRVTATLHVLELPLRRSFVTARGSVGERRVVLAEVGSEVPGWGEAAPYPGQDEPLSELLAAARSGIAMPTLRAALDEARADRAARLASVSLAVTAQERVPISVAVGIDGASEQVERLVEQGVTRFKVKVAPERSDHIERLRADHPAITIGVDGNQSFDSLDGIGDVLVRARVAYAEELLAPGTRDDTRRLAEAGIPHFADESLRSLEHVRGVVRSGRFTGVTIKPGRLGWTGAKAVRDLARDDGIAWRASGLLETGIGRAFTDHLAAEPGSFISDVAPAEWFFERDVCAARHEDGHIVVPRGPGLGVAPDPDALDACTVDRFEVEVSVEA